MEPKFCPLLRIAGFVNAKEICSEECALYCECEGHCGCALAILAQRMVANTSNSPLI